MNNGPIQTSIMQNLTRWDFRNLLLAGIRISVSRGFQRRHQKPTRCNEGDPERPGKRCANTTESFDDIRACAGHPALVFRKGKIHLEDWLGAQEIQPCLQHERFRVWESNPDNEPNVSKYPIHSKVCRRCRDFYAAQGWHHHLLIARFRQPLCKRHSLAHSNRFPLNACHCLAYVNDKWRCRRCCIDTMDFVEIRAIEFRRSRPRVKTPWSRPWAYLTRLWARSEPQFCPIDGCTHQPWRDLTRRERMQLCFGCNAICSI